MAKQCFSEQWGNPLSKHEHNWPSALTCASSFIVRLVMVSTRPSAMYTHNPGSTPFTLQSDKTLFVQLLTCASSLIVRPLMVSTRPSAMYTASTAALLPPVPPYSADSVASVSVPVWCVLKGGQGEGQ